MNGYNIIKEKYITISKKFYFFFFFFEYIYYRYIKIININKNIIYKYIL